jgi:hypothetical protein
MSAHRPRRIDRGAAERLLRGGPVNAGVGADPLADLLAAVAAPAGDGELDGEEVAVAAFREARLAQVPQPRRRFMIKMLLARLLTVKVAAIAAGATVISGAAVAASTGVLPVVGGGGSAAVSATATPSAVVEVPSVTMPSAGASVSASLLALCHSYTVAAATDTSTALDSPDMSALVTAAGGRGKVDAFCVKALRAQDRATATPSAGVGASVGPGGAGTGVAVPPSASVNVGPAGAGVGAQVPSAGLSAGPDGAGIQVGPSEGVGANVGTNSAGVGASTAAPVQR